MSACCTPTVRHTGSPFLNIMSVGTDCVRCGTCASICPSGNIVIGEKKAEIGDKCLHCYACYNICPNGAIKYEGRNDHYKGLVKIEELKRR